LTGLTVKLATRLRLRVSVKLKLAAVLTTAPFSVQFENT
jgi:hypothetical protein